MLKQNSDIQEPPAAEMRVKKEEFARAIAALEARRQAEAQQQEGTVVIGDVLQQLQINLPAEEVLQEIQSIHAGQPHDQPMRRPLWNTEQAINAKLVAAIILIPLAAIAIGALAFNPLNSPANSPKPTAMATAPSSFPFWMMPTPPNIPTDTTGEVMDEGGFNASSVLKPLSSVPNDQPIHCTTESLQQLLYSGFLSPVLANPNALARSKQLFDVRPNLHKPWILIKHGNQVYLRGWVTAKFTDAQAQGHLVSLHSSPSSFDPGVQPQPITLRAHFRPYFNDGNPNFGFNPRAASLKAEEVTLDSHAWEKW